MYFVFEYIQKKNVINDWQFRSPNKESNYWINHKEKKVTSEYPYLQDLQKKLREHIAVIEQKVKTTKCKDLNTFKEIMDKPNETALIGFLTQKRSELTKTFLVERSKYMQQMYSHLKKRIERRVQSLKNRQNLGMTELMDDEIDLMDIHKPVVYINKIFSDFVDNPFDMKDFTKVLMSNLSETHILDMLFYNFYDLDRYNRAALGDEVLVLGRRDPLQQYIYERTRRENMANKDPIAEDLNRDLELLHQTDESRIKEILAKSIELAAMAEYIQEKTFASENDRKEYELKYDSARLSYAVKYGDVGRIINEALREKKAKSKWNVFDAVNKTKNKLLPKDRSHRVSSTVNMREPALKNRKGGYSEAGNLDDSDISSKSKMSNKSKLNTIDNRKNRASSSIQVEKRNNFNLLKPGNKNRIDKISTATDRIKTGHRISSRYSQRHKSNATVDFDY